MHLMIDIETYALTPRAHVASIGAVLFDPLGGYPQPYDRFYAVLTDPGQEKRDRDPGTQRWWMKQAIDNSAAARELLDPVNHANSATPFVALSDLAAFFGRLQDQNAPVWGNGPQFDLVILETLYADLGLSCPWSRRAPRDVRTLREAAWGDDPRTATDYPYFLGVEHHALDDAIHQAEVVQVAHYRLARKQTAELASDAAAVQLSLLARSFVSRLDISASERHDYERASSELQGVLEIHNLWRP